MEVGKAHATCGQAIEDWSLRRTTVTAEVAVPEVVHEQGDDVRAFVFSKTGANQQQGAKQCEDGFHVISFWVRQSAARFS